MDRVGFLGINFVVRKKVDYEKMLRYHKYLNRPDFKVCEKGQLEATKVESLFFFEYMLYKSFVSIY